MTTLSNEVFNSLSNIYSLSMKINSIQAFDPLIFKPLKKLTNLDLGTNNLTIIDSKFKELTNLKSINLNNNQIEFIDVAAFSNLSLELKKICLDHNPSSLMKNFDCLICNYYCYTPLPEQIFTPEQNTKIPIGKFKLTRIYGF